MGEGASRTAVQWLSQGLAHRAAGDDARAGECWRRVLELEPAHESARGYLAEGRSGPTPMPDPPEGPAELLPEELREEALELLAGGLVEDAYQLLTTPALGKADLETLAVVELLRTHLVDDVLMQVGSASAVLIVEMAGEELMKLNLPSDAGFLLSRIDGRTPVEDLVSLSGMDPFETFHTLGRLLAAGIVGVVD